MVGNGARVERDTQVPAGTVIELKGAAAARAALTTPLRAPRPQPRDLRAARTQRPRRAA
jgi:hypothetical protein